MSIAPRRETFWHVTEMVDTSVDSPDLSRMQSFTVANTRPRVLRWVAEPHLETHRVIEARRQRVASGPSGVRLVLESLKEPRRQIILHALMITLVAVR